MKLRISPDLSLPQDVVTSTTVVYGGKGMGKSNLASVIMEEASKAGLRWSALDPMGVLWGIRHSADGKGPGVPCVILGGAHGDIPIEPTGGAIVADLVVDENVNTIVDFSRKTNGQMWTVGEKIRFVTDYTLRLFQRQGELVNNRRREPILQILDEAARYIPQTIPSGAIDLAKCVGAWEQVCEEGRNIGLGVAFITQRSARMNKSVSELADVMFAFRTIGPNSLSAIMDWLGEHVEKARVKELAEKVRALDVGQALVVSPGWLKVEKIAAIRLRDTFDSSATPRPGQQARRVSGNAAKPDLAAYQQRMAATIERVKADDPKALRAEILALKKQIAAVPAQSAAKVPVDQGAIDRAVEKARAHWIRDMRRVVGKDLSQLAGAIDKTKSFAGRFDALLTDIVAGFTALDTDLGSGKAIEAMADVRTAAEAPVSNRRDPVSRRVSVPARSTDVANGLSRGQQKVLNALAELKALGVDAPSRHQLGMVAGYNLTGGSGAQHVADLAANGFAETGDGVVRITRAGLGRADAAGVPTTLDELHDRVLAKLSDGQRRIAEYLISIYPKSISRADLGEATNYNLTGGSGAQHVADLVTIGAAKIPSKGEVVASDLLFPEGLR